MDIDKLSFTRSLDMGRGGEWSVTAGSLEEATEAVVRLAIKDGWRPRKWWEFWRPKVSASVFIEYWRQAITPQRAEGE